MRFIAESGDPSLDPTPQKVGRCGRRTRPQPKSFGALDLTIEAFTDFEYASDHRSVKSTAIVEFELDVGHQQNPIGM